MAKTTGIETALGTFEAHPVYLNRGTTAEVRQTLMLPEDGVTINGVTYVGHMSATAYAHSPERGYLDASMLERRDVRFSWGTVTDAARAKLEAAVRDAGVFENLLDAGQSAEWKTAQAVRDAVSELRHAVRSSGHNAWRIAQETGTSEADIMTALRAELEGMTGDDLTI